MIRGRGDVEGLIAPLTALVRSLDRNQPLYNVMTLERIVFAPLARLRLMVLMMLLFAASSVAVAAVGVHAATSRAVADRMSELAIRLAVGSSRGSLFRTVVKVGMRPVLAGTVVGLMMAHALVRLLGTRLEGLLDGPMLPAYAGVALLVCVLGLAGMIVPAMKAMSADPIALLRSQ